MPRGMTYTRPRCTTTPTIATAGTTATPAQPAEMLDPDAPPVPPRPGVGARAIPSSSGHAGSSSDLHPSTHPRRKPAPPVPPAGAEALAYQPRQPRPRPPPPPRPSGPARPPSASSPSRSAPALGLGAASPSRATGPGPGPAVPRPPLDEGTALRERTGRLLARGESYLASRDWRALGSSAKSRLGGLLHQTPYAGPAPSAASRDMDDGSAAPAAALAAEMTPVLLPGFALAHPDAHGEEPALSVYCHGLVLRVPQTPGTKQRIFNTMARQMAGIPKAPQATRYMSASAPPSPPSSSSSSRLSLTQPRQPPDLLGGPMTDEPESEPAPGVDVADDAEAASDRGAATVSGAPAPREPPQWQPYQGRSGQSKRLSALQRLSSLPAKAEAAWLGGTGAGTHTGLVPGQVHDSSGPGAGGGSGASGGGSPWAGRSAEELQVLRFNLESRLHEFWSYRVDWCPITLELQPVLRRPVPADGAPALPPPRPRGSPLLAVSSSRAGAGGTFDVTLSVSRARRDEFMRKVYPGHSWDEVDEIKVRAVLGSAERGAVQPSGAGKATAWQAVETCRDGPKEVRVVSDIDDTLKLTEVTAGMRTVFQNVFVRTYREVLVPGASDWLGSLASRGVGVHYLSNAPNELHTIVLDFLTANQFPAGHVHLKDYPSGAFDLISSWLEPAGERKRPGLNRILAAFPESNFVLLGDSGELDLDIYTSLAMEHPHRIRAIYIRDVHSPRALDNPDSIRVARLLAHRNRRIGFPTSYDADVVGLGTSAGAGGEGDEDADGLWPPLAEGYPSPSSKFSNLLMTLPPPYGTAPPMLTEGDVPGDDAVGPATPRRRTPQELFYIRIRRAVELLPPHTLLTVFARGDPVPVQEAQDVVQHIQVVGHAR